MGLKDVVFYSMGAPSGVAGCSVLWKGSSKWGCWMWCYFIWELQVGLQDVVFHGRGAPCGVAGCSVSW